MMNPVSIALLETCFSSQFYPLLFSGRETNDPAFRLVGQLARHTQDESLVLGIIKSGLPGDYSGNTLEEVPGMLQRALNKGFDQPEAGNTRSSPAALLVSLVHQIDGIKLFHDSIGKTYISHREFGGGRITYPLMSKSAELFLKKVYFTKMRKVITGQAFKEAHETLQAQALFDNAEEKTHLRIARHENKVIVDLADKEGRVVIIDEDGYTVSTESPISFVKSPAMLPLPLPQENPDFHLKEFQELLAVDSPTFERIIAFIMNCLKPDGPYLFLLTQGEHGSGKSLLTEIIKRTIDPSYAPKLNLPDSERDLMIQAKDVHLLAYDNVSGLRGNISDALCSLSTGGGFMTRKLYTDDETQIFSECRPFILNGITGVAGRADLLDRSLSLKLPTMRPGKRKPERKIRALFDQMHPFILAKLFKGVSWALANFDQTEDQTKIRMADAAKWLMAAEEGLGFPEGSMLRALENSQQEINIDVISKNSLAMALVKCVEKKPFEGTVGELYDRISLEKAPYDRSFPPTSAHLSGQLERLRPALAKAGINVEFGARTRKGKPIRVWLSDEQILDSAADFEPGFGSGFKPHIDI